MEIKKLWSRRQAQIFVWPGEEPLTLTYNGYTFVVPSRFETAKPGPKSIYAYESARTGKGDLIPGTILVKDRIEATANGGQKLVFDVQAMCEYLTRDRDELFRQGFNIVTMPNEVVTAMEIGLPLYEASQDERAKDIIAKEMERRKKFEDKGTPYPPSSSEHLVMWAIGHLKNRQAARKPMHTSDELRAALEGRYLAEATPATIPVPYTAQGQELYDQAKAAGVVLTKAELQGILENDEEQIGFVRAKIQARKEYELQQQIEKTAGVAAT